MIAYTRTESIAFTDCFVLTYSKPSGMNENKGIHILINPTQNSILKIEFGNKTMENMEENKVMKKINCKKFHKKIGCLTLNYFCSILVFYRKKIGKNDVIDKHSGVECHVTSILSKFVFISKKKFSRVDELKST